jgi:hypothetical protein
MFVGRVLFVVVALAMGWHRRDRNNRAGKIFSNATQESICGANLSGINWPHAAWPCRALALISTMPV